MCLLSTNFYSNSNKSRLLRNLNCLKLSFIYDNGVTGAIDKSHY